MKRTIAILSCLTVLFLSACSAQSGSSLRAAEPLQKKLTDLGYQVSVEAVSGDEFAGEKYLFEVNRTPLYVYIYDNDAAASKDAANISSDGFTYASAKKTSNIDWTADPHYYLYENQIIVYFGDDTVTEDTLSQLFGTSFAGE